MRIRRLVTTAAIVGAAAVGFGVHGALGAGPQVPSFASLAGSNEAQPADPDGRGSATFIIDGGTLCFGLSVTNIGTPTGAHIHVAKPGQNGPIVVPLTAPSTGDPGASSGCVAVSADLAENLQAHPHDYYVNVHTTQFPGGAIRGQVFQRHA